METSYEVKRGQNGFWSKLACNAGKTCSMNASCTDQPQVKALVLTGYGLNCDTETAYAIELAGAAACRVHINDLISGQVALTSYQLLVLGGGFSWGDDHGAGVLEAVRLKYNIGSQLKQFLDDGNLILGICNGFQALVNLGLLPALRGDYSTRQVALTTNDCGNFRDAWVHLAVNPASSCVFTKGMKQIELPIRHGEGKFYAAPQTVKDLFANGQVVLQYALPNGELANEHFPENPNGSIHDIAGICDPSGHVFGLMPHPEAFVHWTNHPDWTQKKSLAQKNGECFPPRLATPGVELIKNGVEHVRQRLAQIASR